MKRNLIIAIIIIIFSMAAYSQETTQNQPEYVKPVLKNFIYGIKLDFNIIDTTVEHQAWSQYNHNIHVGFRCMYLKEIKNKFRIGFTADVLYGMRKREHYAVFYGGLTLYRNGIFFGPGIQAAVSLKSGDFTDPYHHKKFEPSFVVSIGYLLRYNKKAPYLSIGFDFYVGLYKYKNSAFNASNGGRTPSTPLGFGINTAVLF